jgi:hypothetical protein
LTLQGLTCIIAAESIEQRSLAVALKPYQQPPLVDDDTKPRLLGASGQPVIGLQALVQSVLDHAHVDLVPPAPQLGFRVDTPSTTVLVNASSALAQHPIIHIAFVPNT